MEECQICYSLSSNTDWKRLSCQHKLCYLCYLKLQQQLCPFCRKEFIYTKIDIAERQKRINPRSYRPYTPPAQLTNIESFMTQDIYNPESNTIRTRSRRNNAITSLTTEPNLPYSNLNRKRFRNRRRNLTLEEISERRTMIRKRCKQKWERKEGRLNKMNLN